MNLDESTPDALVRRLEQSGLRGRGGGWFPAARKCKAVRAEGGRPLVIANGAEGEPGSFKDRFVMRRRPDDVIEGLRLAARASGASEAVVFLKASFDAPARAIETTLARASLDGLRVAIRRGDDGYITGEKAARATCSRAAGRPGNTPSSHAGGTSRMSRARTSPLVLWLSLTVAMLLQILPLPAAAQAFRPPWVTMAIIYWAMMWPRMCGILTAFVAGLVLDVLSGNLLGQNALALSAVSYLTLRVHLQIRIFPLWQLTMTAFLLMAIDAFLVFWANGIAGYPTRGLARWTQVVAGLVAWAPVMALLDNLRLRTENRSRRFS